MKEKQSNGGGGGSPFKSSKKLMKKMEKAESRQSVGGAPTTNNNRMSFDGKKKDKSIKPKEEAPEVARNKSLLHGVLSQKDQSKKKNDDDAPEVVRNKSLLHGVMGQGQSANVNIVQGIRIEEVQMGTGRRAESGRKVKVNYVGKFKNSGRVFDASKGRPFAFRLGRSEVIKGWDIGVQGMLVGGKRILTIPPEKAYGKSGAPPTIPPNSTLVFEVILLEVI